MSEPLPPCRWCGENHNGLRCPHVRAIEWQIGPTGVPFVSRVEYLTPADLGTRVAKVGEESIEEPAYPTLKPLRTDNGSQREDRSGSR